MFQSLSQPSFALASCYVAIGGGLGAWLRFVAGRGVTALISAARADAFPWGTLTVNLLGSLVMGLLVGWLARSAPHGEGLRLFLAVGILGGFTTFSAFSLETVLLIERGHLALAAVYAGTSVLAGVLALFAGLTIMRSAI